MYSQSIFIPKSKWNKAKHHANLPCDESGANDRYIDSLTEGSKNISKKWKSSYERMMQNQECVIEKRKKEEEISLWKFYGGLMETKRREREQLSDNAKDTIFKEKADIKELENAFLSAEIMREQKAQREFNKKLRQESKLRDKEYIEFMVEKFEEWHKKQCKKVEERKRDAIEYSLLYQKEVEKRRMDRIKAIEDKRKMEKDDLDDALAKMQKEDREALELKRTKQEDFKNYINYVLKMRKETLDKEEELSLKEEKLIEIYKNAKENMEHLRKKREKEIDDFKTKIRKRIASLPNTTAELQKQIDKINEKACEENSKRELERLEKDEAHLKASKEMRIVNHLEWLQRKEKEDEHKKKLKEQEVIECAKNRYYTSVVNGRVRNEELSKSTDIKSFNLKQHKDIEDQKIQDKADRIQFFEDKVLGEMESADMKYFSYASQLLAECETADRPKDPVLKTIRDYKKQYAHTQKHMADKLKSNFPHFFPDEQ